MLRIVTTYFIGVVFILSSTTSDAQIPSNLIGNTPSKLSWFHIDNERVEVIFPEGLDRSAKRVASIVEQMWDLQDPTIGSKRKKVSIVLQAPAAISNGFVTVGPFRSEFFPTPRQFDHPTSFLDRLTIHEYRHVQQFANADHGITRLARKILGSWAWGGLTATALPRWYFEGDAVMAETAFSKSGRGRQPAFLMQYPALIHDDRWPSYEQAAAGSIYRYMPDWYPLGYMLMMYGREKYGDQFWQDVTYDAIGYKGLFHPLNTSVKKRTGHNLKHMYDQAWKSLADQFALHKNNFSSLSKSLNVPDTRYVTDYSNPHRVGELTYAVKSSFAELPHLISIDDQGVESKLIRLGIQLDGMQTKVHVTSRYATWVELSFDRRWRYQSYADVYLYDFAQKTKKRVTSQSKYASPALSSDGERIAAVYTTQDLSHHIHIVDHSGKLIDSIQTVYEQVSYPVWVDTHQIAYIATYDEVSTIMLYDLLSQDEEELISAASAQLSHLSYADGRIYYSSGLTYVNNIYSVDIIDGAVRQHTSAAVGAFQPNVTDDQELLFVEQSSMGIRIKSSSLKEADESPILKIDNEGYRIPYEEKTILANLDINDYEIKKFRKTKGLINFHSLLPQFDQNQASLSLLSDNIFGTLSGIVGLNYNFNEDEISYVTNWRYAGWYPEIDLGVRRSNRNAIFYNFSAISDSTSALRIFRRDWDETRANLGVTLPLNFSKTQTTSRWNLRTAYNYTHVGLEEDSEIEDFFADTLATNSIIEDLYRPEISSASVSSLDLSLSFFHGLRQAPLHLLPKYGAGGFIRWRKNIGGSFVGGDAFNLSLRSFWPGLAKTHGVTIRYDLQQENALDNYRQADIFRYPRGYNVSLRRDKLSKWSFDYAFPLAYPDVAIGGYAFIKRLKANLFLDLGQVSFREETFNISESMNSLGVELGMDFRFLRLVEIDLGVRYSYLLDNGLVNRTPHSFDFFVLSITQ